MTRPKTTWRPSSQEVFTVVMKNWLPFVLGPELAVHQGLTLLHFSAQRKYFLWDRGCI